eukprot:Rmarinus@m.26781
MGGGVSKAELVKLEQENERLRKELEKAKAMLSDGPFTEGRLDRRFSARRPAVAAERTYVDGEKPKFRQEEASQYPLEERRTTKTEKERAVVSESVSRSILFSDLAEPVQKQIIDNMFRLEVNAGDVVFRQGDNGDLFYVATSGKYDIIVTREGQSKVVASVSEGGSFGELALMYNAPRAATVKAVADGVLFAADRQVYMSIIIQAHRKQKDEFLGFLRSIPEFNSMNESDMSTLASVLENDIFDSGSYIIREGDVGDRFYIIRSGEVRVLKDNSEGREEEVRRLKKGDYFGELALINDDRRAASVVAEGNVETLSLKREIFIELVGTMEEIRAKASSGVAKVDEKETDLQASREKYRDLTLDDLTMHATLGAGGYGMVKLVENRKDPGTRFALKMLNIQHIIRHGQEEHILDEKIHLHEVNHPFIINLYRTFRDTQYLYMLLELSQGGELFTILRKRKRFDDKAGRFYAASVVLCFEYLHNRHLIYRDLKPENLLLDAEGYLKLADFGFVKRVPDRTFTACGTPEYMAPELLKRVGYNKGVDYWALGILIYELLTGQTPFVHDDPLRMYEDIIQGVIKFPKHMNKAACDLITNLCRSNPLKRYGCSKNGVADIKQHRWFQGFDWKGLVDRELPAPYVPKLNDPNDTSNFSNCPVDAHGAVKGKAKLTKEFTDQWDDF